MGAVFIATVLVASPAAAAPGNDNFASAQVLSGTLPFTIGYQSNVGATKEAGEPNHAGYPGGSSVWYAWTPASSGAVTIETCSFAYWPLLGVYTGTAVNSLARVASNTRAFECATRTRGARVNFNVTAGTKYMIAVDAEAGAQGEFDLTIKPSVAPNDNLAHAQHLSGWPPAPVAGNVRYATHEEGEPNHAGRPGYRSLWYSWTPSTSGRVAVDTCGAYFDSLLAVYTGSTINALTQVAANDDYAPGEDDTGEKKYCGVDPNSLNFGSRVTFNATAGTTYRIVVDWVVSSGFRTDFTLEFSPANDMFADAWPVVGALPQAVNASNWRATAEAGEPQHAGFAADASVWFRWTPSATGWVSADTCTAEYLNTTLAVYTGAGVGSLTRVAGNNNTPGCGPYGDGSRVTFRAIAGTTYRIAVDDGYPTLTDWGEFQLRLSPTAPPSGSIAGKVTDAASGNPITGATVDCGPTGSATTASTGDYAIGNVADDTHSCTASKLGYLSETQPVYVSFGRTTTADFALTKEVPGSIGGIVKSTTGAAIGSATVDCGPAGKATTGLTGAYTIASVVPGTYSCTASKTGYASQTRSVTVSSGAKTTADFALRKIVAGSIGGTVTNATTGGALGSVKVSCGTAGSATTASTGAYTISNVAPGTYSCTASKAGYVSQTRSVAVSEGTKTTASFALFKTGSIGGIVKSTTGAAIGSATVDCGPAGKATTGLAGAYTIANVAPGTYSCTASKTGYASQTRSVAVSSAAKTSADFALVRSG